METQPKELVVVESSGKPTGSKAPVTSLTAIRKGLPVNESLYRQAIQVNGQVEFEEPWSFLKLLFGQLYFLCSYIEAFIIQGVFYLLVWPFLNPKSSLRKDPRKRPTSYILYLYSTAAKFMRYNATTWRATEYIYTWDKKIQGLRGVDSWLTRFLGTLENMVAVRNRIRATKQALFWQIHGRLSRGDSLITIASVAAGSARAVFEVIASFLEENPEWLQRFRIILIDGDPESLRFAQELARELFPGLEERLAVHELKISGDPHRVKDFEELLASYRPDVVEMVGLIDYKTTEKSINIIGAIYRAMNLGGVLFTNNAKPNHEAFFLKICVSWPMVYKTETEMLSILSHAGFGILRTVNEPCNVHPLYLCLKDVE